VRYVLQEHYWWHILDTTKNGTSTATRLVQHIGGVFALRFTSGAALPASEHEELWKINAKGVTVSVLRILQHE
jgi:hypothetical protein